jgi:biopolymer transport protein TolQ
LHTLGGLFFALLVQGEGSAAPEGTFSIVEALAQSTWVAWGVLVILGFFSIASFGIFLHKRWTFRRSQTQSARFLEVFRRSNKFSEVQAVCRSLGDSPLVGLFLAGYTELTAQLRQNAAAPAEAAGAHPNTPAVRPTLKSLPAVDRALLRASVVEVTKLEQRLPFLATTASITPFIGLFGTVWGILITFGTIGEMGSTNLAVVAPGIAEALVTTAAGLVAAIPAVYFYNSLTHRVKDFASEMDDFSMEFLNIAERNFT